MAIMYKPGRSSKLRPYQGPTPDQVVPIHEAATRSSLQWPKHWRKVIYKITKMQDTRNFEDYWIVYPRNPDHTEWWSKQPAGVDLDVSPPPAALDPIRFSTLAEVDNWATVICRMET